MGTALDHARQRHLNELHGTQLALELLRQQDEQRRQAAQNWPRPPVNPLDAPAAAQAGQPSVAIYAGDDWACPICLMDYRHGDRAVRLQCRLILHRACHLELLQNFTIAVGGCPARRGPADAIADFRFIGAPAGPGPMAPAREAAARDAPEEAAPQQDAEEESMDFGVFQAQSPRPSRAPGAPRQDLMQSPESASSYRAAVDAAVPRDTHLDLRMPHYPPTLPWRPTSSGTGASSSTESPCYLASTDLPGGRLGVIVDAGAWANLWRLRLAVMNLAHEA